MSKFLIAYAVAGLMTGTYFTGCIESSGNKVDNAKAAMDTASQDLKVTQAKYSDEWQNFKNESENKIRANENKLQILRDKMEKSGSNLKAKYNNTIVELEHQNRILKNKMDEYKDEGKDKWEIFKSGFNRDMDKVETTLKDLTSDND